jgi:hypothetical protein
MPFDSLSSDEHYVRFRSPNVLREGTNEKSIEELKDTFVLPLERLVAATAWVHFTQNQLTGLVMTVPRHINWDREQKAWVWKVKWMNLMTQFYKLKRQNPRMQRVPYNGNAERLRRSNVPN